MMMMIMLGTQTLLFVVVVILTIVDEIIDCRDSNRTDRLGGGGGDVTTIEHRFKTNSSTPIPTTLLWGGGD